MAKLRKIVKFFPDTFGFVRLYFGRLWAFFLSAPRMEQWWNKDLQLETQGRRRKMCARFDCQCVHHKIHVYICGI